MKTQLNEIMKWSKLNGKIVYVSSLIEFIITIIIASVITWSKTYGLNKSMFQLQTPIFLLGGLITFCSLDSMTLIGRLYERQMLKMLLSTNPWFFFKRYLFVGLIFGAFSMVLAGIMNLNNNVNIGWSFYLTLIMLSIFCVSIFIGIAGVSLLIQKQWMARCLILLTLFQALSSGISLYPFFVDNLNPWVNSSIGIIFPIFTVGTILNNINTSFHLSALLPIVINLLFAFGSVYFLKSSLKWNIKKIF